ncbi:unnamed protein product, partial [Meganyctiphanes norvegica]
MSPYILKERQIRLLELYCFLRILQQMDITQETSHTNGGENSKLGKCLIPNLIDYDQFYAYLDKPKASCIKKEQVGGVLHKTNALDGDKWVCFDKGFKPDNCVVYSFGINNEWSFDDAMDQKHHCKVFAFDPTMRDKDHKRSQRISFFNLGISDYKGYTVMGGRKCTMDRYRGIVEKLGHSYTTVCVISINAPRRSLLAARDILLQSLGSINSIGQITFIKLSSPIGEMVSQLFKDFWDIFHRLECHGWRLLNAEMNQVAINHFRFRGVLRSQCYEVVFIKS